MIGVKSAVVGRERVLAELGELLAAARAGSGSVVLLTGEAAIGERATEATAAVRFRIGDRTCRALVSAAEPVGLVSLFEDIQWADEASVALLRHVCREVADARILLLCTVRAPTPEASDVDLGDLAGAHVIRLAPFTVEEVAASVAAIAGGPVDGSWPVYVHRVSGGNPLFVRELVRLLATEGRLGAPAVDVPVPAQLRRVAMRRMARLGPGCWSRIPSRRDGCGSPMSLSAGHGTTSCPAPSGSAGTGASRTPSRPPA